MKSRIKDKDFYIIIRSKFSWKFIIKKVLVLRLFSIVPTLDDD